MTLPRFYPIFDHVNWLERLLPLGIKLVQLRIKDKPEAELRARIDGAEAVAIMKVGRHLGKIRSVIADLGLLDRAVFVARATLADEVICPLGEAAEPAPYFSMILLTKGADP